MAPKRADAEVTQSPPTPAKDITPAQNQDKDIEAATGSGPLPLPEMTTKPEEKVESKSDKKPLDLQTDKQIPEPKKQDVVKSTAKPATDKPFKPASESAVLPIDVTKNTKQPPAANNAIKPSASTQEPEKPVSKEENKSGLKISSILFGDSKKEEPKPAEEKVAINPVVSEDKKSEDMKAVSKPTPLFATSEADIEPAAQEPEISPAEQQRREDVQKSLKKIQIWEGSEGAGLKRMLTKWTEQAGVKLVWNTKEKFELEMDLYVSGTLENALKTLFTMGVKNGPKYAVDAEAGTLTISD